MRILHISAQKPDSTGSGIYMSGLINGFNDLVEEQAMVVGIDKSDSIDKIKGQFKNEISIYPVLYNSGNLNFNVPGMSDNMPYPSTRYRDVDKAMSKKMKDEIIKVVDRAVSEFKPDIILCHHLYFITSIVKERYNDILVCGICHGTCLRQLKSNDFEREYIIDSIKKLDYIFSLHEEQSKDIEEIFGIPISKIVEIGSGYNSDIFYNKRYSKYGEIIISYVGKLSFSKGLLPFISSINKLSEKDIKFVLIGSGSDESEVNKIKELAVQSKVNIEFMGRLEQKQVAELLNKSDIFVLPSYYEGLPLVLLEALSCGNYVISTDIPGVRKWLGPEIESSDLVEFIKLPNMKDISTPEECEIPDFEKRISMALEKSINYRKNNRNKFLNINHLSWNSLSKKIYGIISNKHGA